MITEIEQRYKERQIIKKESLPTIRLSVILVGIAAVLGCIAYFVKVDPWMPDTHRLESIYDMINLILVVLMVLIIGVRRTIYYSPRLINEDGTLTDALKKWRLIDMSLLAVAGLIPIIGLIITFMGMPFPRTFHFFVTAGVLMMIIMPLGFKVKSKLFLLKKSFPELIIE